MNEQQNKRRKKRPLNLPAVMFFGLLITCAVVAGRNLLHKGDDLLQDRDSGTILAADPKTSGAYINKNGDSTYSNFDKSQWNLTLVNKWILLL